MSKPTFDGTPRPNMRQNKTGEVVEAYLVDPENVPILAVWCQGSYGKDFVRVPNANPQHPGHRARCGDIIIRWPNGTFSVKDSSIFQETFTPLNGKDVSTWQ